MKKKQQQQLLLIIGLLIVAGLLAHWLTSRVNTQPQVGENGQKITAPNIKQEMCEKNGRFWDTELEKCTAIAE